MFETAGVISKTADVLRRFVAVVALTACVGLPAFAAPPTLPWLYRAYQAEDGLPDISITGLAQTSDGYLWIGTKGGLLCFNGESVTPLPPGNLPALPSRTVRALYRDHRDQLWLAMERGPVLCFKGDRLETYSTADGLSKQRVVLITEDKEGAVWLVRPTQLSRILDHKVQPISAPAEWSKQALFVGTSDRAGNFWCAKGRHIGVWRDGQWQSKIRLNDGVTALSAGSKSNLWVCAGDSVSDFREGKPPLQVAQLPSNAIPRVVLEDRSGALWIGTASEGLFCWAAQHLEKVPTSNPEINCLYEDQEGNIWAGTEGGGLNLIRPRAAGLVGREAGLPFDSVQSVSEDNAGYLWAVAQDGQVARARDKNWELLSAGKDWPGGSATCVAADPVNGVWLGTSDQGLKSFQNGIWRSWFQRDGLASDAIRSLLVASNGDVWAASTMPNCLHRLRHGQMQVITNGSQLGAIRALAEGVDGTIWIGTAEGQVQRVRGSALVSEPTLTETLPLSVRSLLTTPGGHLWIGYAGDGLGHLKDGKYQRLTTASGLTDDFVSQLLADGRGNLWTIGNRGLARMSLADLDNVIEGKTQRLSARAYGKMDGLPGMQPNRNYCPSAWQGRDGRLWFCMHSGLLTVQPANVHDNPRPPQVHLESVNVDDEVVAVYNAGSPLQLQPATNCLNLRALDAPLRLGPNHRKLEIAFAALSFASPENVRFRYRLSQFDAGWIEAGQKQQATYPRLPAGNYQFQVIACNNSGVWNEAGAILALEVAPFFYETWWFKLGGAVITALLAASIAFALSRRRYRQKIRRLEARRALEQERARIAKDIHDDLGATLTRISLLSQPARNGREDPEPSAATMAQIHHAARDLTHAMGEVVWAVNPEHDTFDSLANYLSSYAQNFLRIAGIRCRIEMPLHLPNQTLSAEVRHNLFLAFKEALNNVVKHAGATEVRISLTPNETGVDLLVADNGRGIQPGQPGVLSADEQTSRPASGNGLFNMRSRLREIAGECDLQSEPGAGTKITFRVKLKQHHEQP